MGEARSLKLRYTPQALTELDEVLGYITVHSPGGAHRVKLRIQKTTDLLLRHPNAGRQTSLRNIRRIATTPFPYLIFYQVKGDEIVVVAVRHAMRDPGSMPGEETR